jgi:hypothetical protein
VLAKKVHEQGSKLHHITKLLLASSALNRSEEMHAGRILRVRQTYKYQEEWKNKKQRDKRRHDGRDDGTAIRQRATPKRMRTFSSENRSNQAELPQKHQPFYGELPCMHFWTEATGWRRTRP